MQNLQNNKIVQVIPPGAIVDNASPATAVIDTAGYHEMAVYVILGAIDTPITALKLQQSDQFAGPYTDVEGGNFAGSLPDANADNTTIAFFVDLRGKSRYFDVVLTCGDGAAGTYVTIVAVLGRPSQNPTNPAKRGLSKQVII